MENGNVGQGSSGPGSLHTDVGRPDSTQTMPIFDQGKAVESISVEEAKIEWQEMTIDRNGKYVNWPRSVFNERRGKLHSRGFGEKIEQDKIRREEETKSWLESEKERFEDRDDKEALEKARHDLELYFGGPKEADTAVKAAKGIFKRFATPADIAFVEKSGLGNDPEFIQKLAEIGDILKRGGQKRR